MDVDGRTVVYIEVVLDREEGKVVKHSEIGEEIAGTIYGSVYVGDSVYDAGYASDVTDYVGGLIREDLKRRRKARR